MKHDPHAEEGAIAVVVAVLTVVLVGVMAFVVDFGLAYAHKRTLQNGVDAAALAAAQEVLEVTTPTANCATMLGSTTSADTLGRSIFTENSPVPSSALLTGTNGLKFACDPTAGGNLVVTATGSQTSPSLFAGILNGGAIDLGLSAKAVVAPVGEPLGLRPFAVCKIQAQDLLSAPGTIKTFTFRNIDTGCGAESGAFGLLDLNSTVDHPAGGCDDLDDWLTHGFADSLPSFPYVLSEQGNCYSSLPMSDIIDKEIVLPVYDSMSKVTGKNIYHVIGFITVEPCGWGNDVAAPVSPYRGNCFNPSNWTTAATAAGLSGQGSDPYALQVRYAKFMPPGDLDLGCKLGDATCDLGTRAVKLAD